MKNSVYFYLKKIVYFYCNEDSFGALCCDRVVVAVLLAVAVDDLPLPPPPPLLLLLLLAPMPPDEAAAGRSVDMDAKAAGPLLPAGPWLLVSSERPLGRKRAVCSALVTSNDAASSIEPNAGDPDWSDIRGREECARPPPAAVYIFLSQLQKS